MTTSTGNDPWALSGSFYSVIVKRSAVTRSYPGGVEAFEQREQPARKNGALFLIASMEAEAIEAVLVRLYDAGVIPGADVAVASLRHGPLVECPEIAFRSDGDLLFPKWTVNVDPDYAPEGSAADRWEPPELAPQPEPKEQRQTPQPPPGLTANQYYQWRGLHLTHEEEDE